mmetsp:Transcript_67185/g.151065  ORF Transcript_67185/g.151065 Transcript_67185/m.151065 type:complete len:208 (+) Transcript_67185:211-834(+)
MIVAPEIVAMYSPEVRPDQRPSMLSMPAGCPSTCASSCCARVGSGSGGAVGFGAVFVGAGFRGLAGGASSAAGCSPPAASVTFRAKIRAISRMSTPPFFAASRAAFIRSLSPDCTAAASSSKRLLFCSNVLRCSSRTLSRRTWATLASSIQPLSTPSSTRSAKALSLPWETSMRFLKSIRAASFFSKPAKTIVAGLSSSAGRPTWCA